MNRANYVCDCPMAETQSLGFSFVEVVVIDQGNLKQSDGEVDL